MYKLFNAHCIYILKNISLNVMNKRIVTFFIKVYFILHIFILYIDITRTIIIYI